MHITKTGRKSAIASHDNNDNHHNHNNHHGIFNFFKHEDYNDIDTHNLKWMEGMHTDTKINKMYVTGDIVGIYLDTDKKEVRFSLNEKKITLVSRYEKDCILQAAIGFNYRSDNTEQYTIISYSWW